MHSKPQSSFFSFVFPCFHIPRFLGPSPKKHHLCSAKLYLSMYTPVVSFCFQLLVSGGESMPLKEKSGWSHLVLWTNSSAPSKCFLNHWRDGRKELNGAGRSLVWPVGQGNQSVKSAFQVVSFALNWLPGLGLLYPKSRKMVVIGSEDIIKLPGWSPQCPLNH